MYFLLIRYSEEYKQISSSTGRQKHEKQTSGEVIGLQSPDHLLQSALYSL